MTNDITPEDRSKSAQVLNHLYGDMGRTFPTLEQAEQFAAGKPRTRIYALWDGVREMRHRVGYLVSIDPPPAPPRRFSGKVRVE